eukprot:TRINITY_DN1471_c0_g1_i2.p1 TRINITY_DN1471_c0_g1~~TRINITY_DN1471_c0_g1_i2.p1  ORF type:complete len:317 (-),score=65.66 TRINITY_DN1471_c0_g1_i2:9-863(-)
MNGQKKSNIKENDQENDQENDKFVIPKFIFQTNKMAFDDLTPTMKEMVQKIKELNPDYKYKYYSEEEVKKLLSEKFGEDSDELKTYTCFKPGSFRGDFFRMAILYLYGGIHLDIDTEPIKPLDEFLDRENYTFAVCKEEIDIGLNSGFMASVAGHPILKKNIDMMIYNCKNRFMPYVPRNFGPWEASIYAALAITGPTLLHKIVNTYLDRPEDAPVITKSDKNYKIQLFQYCWWDNIYSTHIGNCKDKDPIMRPKYEGFDKEMNQDKKIKSWSQYQDKLDFYVD